MNTTTVGPSPQPMLTPPAPVWRLAVASFAEPSKRPRVDALLRKLPMMLILVAQGVLTLRLSNSAFQDEALYINTGHDLIAHWLHGSPTGNPGDYFSGAPAAYPVLAALLDSVGGLWLVRLFSLICMLLTTVLVKQTTDRLFSYSNSGTLAAAAFVLCGPVIFLGRFATFDAACLLSLSLALWFGVRRTLSWAATAGMGVALAAATTLKYTGGLFDLPILFLALISREPTRQRILQVTAGGALALALLVAGLARWGYAIWAGVKFTTTSRQAMFPEPIGDLVWLLVQDIGILLVLALAGGVVAMRMRRSAWTVLTVLALVAAASLIPASQMRLGEAVSFEKHLAYSAIFLAPLAGIALTAVSRRGLRMLGVFAILFILLLSGLSRSLFMYTLWPDSSKIVPIVMADPRAGQYLSTASDALRYYTEDQMPLAQWHNQYGLFGAGPDAVRKAVADRDYQYVIFRSGSSGSAAEDANMAVLQESLNASSFYELAVPPFPTRQYSTEDWYVYRLK